jgi:hypothetical protein
MSKVKKYRVWFRVVGEQGIEVSASSKKEAIEKGLNGSGEPIDFNVLYSLPSTAYAEINKEGEE